MAIHHHHTLLAFSLSLLSFLAFSAAARPCKTVIFITSSSEYPTQNPIFYITEIRQINPNPNYPDHLSRFPADIVSADVSTSVRDLTLDIVSVVGAILFGVGCGALTAASMYFIWSLFSPYRFDFAADSDSDAVVSPKKLGYMAVAADGFVHTTSPVKQVD